MIVICASLWENVGVLAFQLLQSLHGCHRLFLKLFSDSFSDFKQNNIFVTWIILSILRNCASSWWHNIWIYILIFTQSYQVPSMYELLTNINKIHSIHIWHIAKTFSFDDSQSNTFEEVYPFGKWVKGVSGMEVKWKWGDNVLKVRHSQIKVETQWGESRIWMFCKNVTWSSPTLAILSRPSPPPLSHALQGFIIASDNAGDDDDGNDDDASAC